MISSTSILERDYPHMNYVIAKAGPNAGVITWGVALYDPEQPHRIVASAQSRVSLAEAVALLRRLHPHLIAC